MQFNAKFISLIACITLAAAASIGIVDKQADTLNKRDQSGLYICKDGFDNPSKCTHLSNAFDKCRKYSLSHVTPRWVNENLRQFRLQFQQSNQRRGA
jgi:hypothetical protein